MVNTPITIDENDSALVAAFHSLILRSMVYIERTCLSTGRTVAGTGTVFGYQGNATDGWLPYIASAGHLLFSDVGAESRFTIRQFDWTDPAHPTERVLDFESGGKDGRSPCAISYIGPFKDIYDIGFIRGPIKCTDGSCFFETDGDGIPNSGTMPIETGWNWAAEGTSVAWAGFPALATKIAQRPQPCYFAGCISALILRDDYQIYLVDGHNTFGVSGGPVWSLDANTQKSRIIGVISGYTSRSDAPQLPGLVRVVPIQPLRSFLENNWGRKQERVKGFVERSGS